MAKVKGASDFGWVRAYRVKDKVNGGTKQRYQASYLSPRDSSRVNAPHTFDRKIDAFQWLSAERELISAGRWSTPEERMAAEQVEREREERRKQPFGVFAQHWFDKNKESYRARTRQTYSQLLNTRILPTFGDCSLDDISIDMVSVWFDSLAKTPTARANAYNLMKQILNAACTPPDPILAFNPCCIRGGGSRRHSETEIATPKQIEAIALAMPEPLQLIVWLAAWLSLRSGEVRALRREDIDLKNCKLRITHAVVYTKEDGFIDADPKTDAGRRTLDIPQFLVPKIRRHLSAFVEKAPQSLLFTNTMGGFLHDGVVEKHFIKARVAAGCPHLRFHDLRHTGNTLAAETGLATIADLQKRGGWSTPAMAIHYMHTTEDRQQAITRALSDLASGVPRKGDVRDEDVMARLKALEEENRRLKNKLEGNDED